VGAFRLDVASSTRYPLRSACNPQPALSFLDNHNVPIDPSFEALNVSNFVSAGQTGDNLPPGTDVDITSTDADNFRLEVTDETAAAAGRSQVFVLLQILRATPGTGCSGLPARDITYTLTKSAGLPIYRSLTIRLVTGDVEGGCLNLPVDDQTIIVRLGDVIRATYSDASGVATVRELSVGRPSAEDYNGPNQRQHDVRNVKVRVTVFSLPDGSAPSATRAEVLDEIERANERFAQSTIRFELTGSVDMGITGRGVALPPALLDGFTSPAPVDRPPNVDERQVAALVDQDPDSIDIFYVPFRMIGPFIDTNNQPKTATPPGVSYPEARRFSDGSVLKNFLLVTSPSVVSRLAEPYILPHELMHILLNNPSHRVGDPQEALFNRDSDGRLRTRIGPFSRDTQHIGDADTATMRQHAERLP